MASMNWYKLHKSLSRWIVLPSLFLHLGELRPRDVYALTMLMQMIVEGLRFVPRHSGSEDMPLTFPQQYHSNQSLIKCVWENSVRSFCIQNKRSNRTVCACFFVRINQNLKTLKIQDHDIICYDMAKFEEH